MSTLRQAAWSRRTAACHEARRSPDREYSLAHLTMLSLAPPELIAVAARAGFSHVGLRLIPFGLPAEPRHTLHDNPDLLQRTRSALRRYGMGVLDVELARICDAVDVTSYRPALEIAAELGARHVLTSVWTQDRERVTAQLLRLWELARPLGLSIELEFVPFSSVRNLAEAIQLLRAVDMPGGLCVDTMHFVYAGCQLEELTSVPGAWFHYAQICDGPARSRELDLRFVARQARQFLGDGNLNPGAILRNLPSMPYSLELPNARLLAQLGPEQFARRCLTSAQRYLADVAPRDTRHAH